LRAPNNNNLPAWTPLVVHQYDYKAGTPDPGPTVDLAQLAVLRRLLTAPAMQGVWRRFERRTQSETVLVQILECAWRNALHTPTIQTPADRLTLVRLWRQEMESLRVTDPKFARYCMLVSLYFDGVESARGVSDSPLVVEKHRRQRDDDRARAYVRVVGGRIRELLGGEFLGSLATLTQVALQLPSIDKSQVQNWIGRRRGTKP
jgi:hypothetical protein